MPGSSPGMTTVFAARESGLNSLMSPSQTNSTAVIGAGPAGLMAAEVLVQGGAHVTVYDAMPSAGRKFLMAGRGGLNLTHSEPLPVFLARYREAMPHLAAAIDAFPPSALRDWTEALGQETFVGSSGRVFPKAFKASPLLRAWLRRLDLMGVRLALRHRWTGWDEQGRLLFQTPNGQHAIEPQATVLVDKAAEESEDELTLSIVKAEKKPVPATVGGKTDQPEEGVDDGGA